MSDTVNHPDHYGGDTVYEVIKVIEAWGLGFRLGNAVKYIARAGKKNPATVLEDLRKAKFYLDREIAKLEEFEYKPPKVTTTVSRTVGYGTAVGGGGAGGGNGGCSSPSGPGGGGAGA